MRAKLSGLSAILLMGLTTVMVTGCGGNLIGNIRNFWSLGFCGIVLVVLDILALLEIAGSNRSTGDKVLWAVLIVIFPFLGLIAYYFFGRK